MNNSLGESGHRKSQMRKYFEAFIDRALVYVVASFIAIVVYISTLWEDSIIN